MISIPNLSAALALFAFLLFLIVGSDASLHSSMTTSSTLCEIKVLDILQYESIERAYEKDAEIEFECVMDASDMDGKSGLTLPIRGTETQINELKQMLKENELIAGRSMLRHGHVPFSKEGIFLPPDLIVRENIIKESAGRNLEAYVSASGNKKILAVKVVDKNGKKVAGALGEFADNIFGSKGDSNTLKSVLEGCSMGKMKITPGVLPNGASVIQKFAGVIQITVNLDVTTTARNEFRNAITAKLEKLLRISLPGPYDHVMYSIECNGKCGYIAYSYDNDWNSVYYDQFYSMPAVQAHEIAHNFNLHHSRGIDGGERSDKTGLMGNPLFQDDDSRICFNPAKNWQLSSNGNNWYSDRKLLLSPRTWKNGNAFKKTFKVVGVADYKNNPQGHFIVAKLETGTNKDYFLGLNIAKGVNANTVEARNQVTLVQAGGNGEIFAHSDMKAHLHQGESYTIKNFGSSGKPLEINVRRINLRVSPQVAEIEVRYGYNAPQSSPLECNDVVLSIKTDAYPGETSWKVVNKAYEMEMRTGGDYTSADTVYDEKLCLEDGDYTLVIKDKYGDGFSHGNGYWKLFFDEKIVVEGGKFSSIEETSFTISGSQVSPAADPATARTPSSPVTVTKAPTSSPTTFPTAAPTSSPTQCSDDPSFKFRRFDFERSCNWICWPKDINKIRKRQKNWCSRDGISESCCAACAATKHCR